MMWTPVLAEANDDAPELRERITCSSAKKIIRLINKFQGLDADKRDTVDMLFDANFGVQDGGVLPERVFMRDNGVEENFTVDAEGNISDFSKIGKASKTSELCSEDPSREGMPRGEGIRFNLTSDVTFLENTGYHDLATLKDGLKDGKSHYKKMVPAPMRVIVPKMTYVMIDYENDDTRPQFTAMQAQTPTAGLDHATFCDNAMIKIEDLETLGADGLKVMGGPYKLAPVPDPKTLAKFASCAEDEETKEE